jgi:hypothetical protein
VLQPSGLFEENASAALGPGREKHMVPSPLSSKPAKWELCNGLYESQGKIRGLSVTDELSWIRLFPDGRNDPLSLLLDSLP